MTRVERAPWGAGSIQGWRVERVPGPIVDGLEQRETGTARAWLLELLTENDPAEELARWCAPGPGGHPLGGWLFNAIIARPLELRAELEGYPLEGWEVADAQEGQPEAPRVEFLRWTGGQVAVRYTWPGMTPLAFLRSPPFPHPFLPGSPVSPDKWRQLSGPEALVGLPPRSSEEERWLRTHAPSGLGAFAGPADPEMRAVWERLGAELRPAPVEPPPPETEPPPPATIFLSCSACSLSGYFDDGPGIRSMIKPSKRKKDGNGCPQCGYAMKISERAAEPPAPAVAPSCVACAEERAAELGGHPPDGRFVHACERAPNHAGGGSQGSGRPASPDGSGSAAGIPPCSACGSPAGEPHAKGCEWLEAFKAGSDRAEPARSPRGALFSFDPDDAEPDSAGDDA